MLRMLNRLSDVQSDGFDMAKPQPVVSESSIPSRYETISENIQEYYRSLLHSALTIGT